MGNSQSNDINDIKYIILKNRILNHSKIKLTD